MNTAKPFSPQTRIRTAEAARLSGLDARTLQEKAAAGLIPGARKIFGRWTYDAAMLARLGTTPCRKVSTSETGFTGRASRSVGSNIAKAYELVLSQSRKSA